MQPGNGRLCAFWLAALIGALREASALTDASIAITHLTLYLWVYTGAAVPQDLHQPLLQALLRINTLPLRTREQNRTASRGGRAQVQRGRTPDQNYLEATGALLLWVFASDRTLRSTCDVRGITRPNGTPLDTDGPLPLDVGLHLFRILETATRTYMQVSDSAATQQDATCGVTVSLRGHGLIASEYTASASPEAAQQIVAQWLDCNLVELVQRGMAWAVFIFGTLARGSVRVPANALAVRQAPATKERYAPLPTSMDGKMSLADAAMAEAAGVRFDRVVRELRSKGATHLPVVWYGRTCEEVVSGFPARRAAFAPGTYAMLMGWGESDMPQHLCGAQMRTDAELQAACSEHGMWLMERAGGAFARLAALDFDQPRFNSIPLASL